MNRKKRPVHALPLFKKLQWFPNVSRTKCKHLHVVFVAPHNQLQSLFSH